MKTIILFTLMAISSVYCFGQTDSASKAADSIPLKSTLTLGAVYANNASYYGQKAQERIPYVAVAANYLLKSGIYFTAQSFKLLNENTTTVSAVNLGAGVAFNLSKKLSADISYSHSFYPENSPLLQAANLDNASIALSYDGWVKPALTGDYAFGKASDAFVTAAISKEINLFSLSDKDIIRITPSADVVGGTQHFYQTYITKKNLRDSILGILTGPPFGNPPTDNSHTKETTAFNLLSYNFKFPLSYNRAHYLVEAAYQLSTLSNQVQAGAGDVNSFFTFSFYYQF